MYAVVQFQKLGAAVRFTLLLPMVPRIQFIFTENPEKLRSYIRTSVQ
jgi:hypothetical protein